MLWSFEDESGISFPLQAMAASAPVAFTPPPALRGVQSSPDTHYQACLALSLLSQFPYLALRAKPHVLHAKPHMIPSAT